MNKVYVIMMDSTNRGETTETIVLSVCREEPTAKALVKKYEEDCKKRGFSGIYYYYEEFDLE